MNSRVLKGVALLLALMIAVGAGAAIGGGIVYAATKVASRTAHVAAAADVDPESGIVVVTVDPDGPAAEAGVVRGDILQAIDGQAVDDMGDLLDYLKDREPNDEVELTILHGDEQRVLTATPGERNGRAYLGLASCRGPADGQRMEHRIMGSGAVPESARAVPESARAVPESARAVVIEVVSDSPAEQAGLRVGDTITAVDGQEVDAENDLADLIGTHEPGDTVTLEVTRPGEESREVAVELGEHPDEEGKAYLGIRYSSFPHMERLEKQFPFRMPPSDKQPFRIPPGTGVERGTVIWHVVKSSPAEAAGLRKGDVITAVDGEPLESPRALADAIAEHEPGDTVTLTVVRPDGTEQREVQVELGENPEHEGSAYLGVMTGGFLQKGPFEGGEFPPEIKRPDQFFNKFKKWLDRLPFDRNDLDNHNLGGLNL